MATVIGIKYDKGILKSACLRERIHDLADVYIHALDHGMELVSFIFFNEVFGRLNGSVNLVWPETKVEGFTFVFLDECHSFIAQSIS